MTVDNSNNEGVPSPNKVSVLVKTGVLEEKVIELVPGSRVVKTVLDVVAAELGSPTEELVLVREGDGEPLAEDVLIAADYPHRRRHHVHYTGEVNVTVFYQSGSHHRDFSRNATVGDVLTWAINIFTIDPSMATEFELARHGIKEELPITEHIGHLAGKQRELNLDLIRGDIANGSY